MIFDRLADLVLLTHLAFILFVVLGGLLVLRWRRLVWLHLPAAVWGMLVEVAGWICPLTPLEVSLRRRAGGAGYEGGFIEHYLTALIYPEGLTREIQLAIAVLVLVVNVVIYRAVWLRRNRSVP
jgi:hypothetical protein